jgi:hypothetical protein
MVLSIWPASFSKAKRMKGRLDGGAHDRHIHARAEVLELFLKDRSGTSPPASILNHIILFWMK